MPASYYTDRRGLSIQAVLEFDRIVDEHPKVTQCNWTTLIMAALCPETIS